MKIVDWRDKINPHNVDNRQRFLILHHTLTDSAEETITILNKRGLSIHYIVEKDGTIYLTVDDDKRTWHTGVSQWGSGNTVRTNLNDTSIGIEMVNRGDEPFPPPQIEAVVELSRMLMDKYGMKPEHILAHAEIAPGRKCDPSGYFDWKAYHTALAFFPGLYDSKLSPEKQKEVIFSEGAKEEDKICTLQCALSQYGYKISITGQYDQDTMNVVEAFNRRFCSEIFLKEKVENDKTIQNPLNARWYELSEERFTFLFNWFSQ